MLKSLRLFEAFLMSGFFLIAEVFAVSELTGDIWVKSIINFVFVYFLILSIYAFNAFGGKKYDVQNERLSHLNNSSSHHFLIFFLFFLLLSFALMFYINSELFIYFVLIEALWITYSLPVFGLKNYPFSGTLIHFINQILHFNMIYTVFAPVSIYSLLVSIYFALLFAAGHLHHEVIDYEADIKSGIKTAAVKYGIQPISFISIFVFFLTALFILCLHLYRIIPFYVMFPLIIAFILQFFVYLNTRKKFNTENKSKFFYQGAYRFFYLTGCIVIILIKFVIN